MQRQATVRQLKRQLFEAQTAVVAAKREAFVQNFLALPCKDQFLDALAMDYRRASTSESHLAAGVFISPHASSEALGHMAYLSRTMLRRGESLYRISEGALGVILPEMRLSDVASLAAQVWELSGIPKDEQEVNITAYPDEADSLTELYRLAEKFQVTITALTVRLEQLGLLYIDEQGRLYESRDVAVGQGTLDF